MFADVYVVALVRSWHKADASVLVELEHRSRYVVAFGPRCRRATVLDSRTCTFLTLFDLLKPAEIT